MDRPEANVAINLTREECHMLDIVLAVKLKAPGETTQHGIDLMESSRNKINGGFHDEFKEWQNKTQK